MESWKITALILCGFGLFKEFRPSEPFLTEYLVDYKLIPIDDVVHVAFPIYTYTYLGTVAIVFLITDFLRYKVVIILEGLAYITTWVLLIWGQGLTALIFIEICYGIACSTEVAYYTYIYAKVDKEHYQKVTAYTYSALFAGRFLGAVVAQLLVSFDLMDYYELNYLSLGFVSVAFAFVLFLPSVQQSIYFHREEQSQAVASDSSDKDNTSQPVSTNNNSTPAFTFSEKVARSKDFILKDLKAAYSNGDVIKWSLWWAVATSGHLQVINYIQALWEVVVSSSDANIDNQAYNGATEAIHTFLSAVLAFGVGHVQVPWSKWGGPLLGGVSVVQGILLYFMSQTSNLYVAYTTYIFYRMLYQVVITIASSEVAQRISQDSYGLIFGINTFLALTVQTILTLVVADDVGLSLDVRKQFLVYGCYHGVLAGIFLIIVIIQCVKYSKR